MKALITAGGRATRMRPITHTLNKHLIPLANKPMLHYAVEKLAEAGITEIIINVNRGDTEIPRLVGDGSRWNVKITYVEQEGGALGIAHAVNNARQYLQGEPFVFYLGDNILVGSLKALREKYETDGLDAMIALSRVENPNRFGVPVFNEEGRLVRAVEKPENPPSPYAITGLYFFNDKFFDAFQTTRPSARGEYEITDIITWYIENARIGYHEITGWWKDTGKPDDLLEGNALLLNELRQEELFNEGIVDKTAMVQGKVKIGKGTVIGPKCLIRGPVVIGENCRIENTFIGPYTSIGNGVCIQNAEIEHSIVFDEALINCGKRIVDALIGQKASVTSFSDTLPRGNKLVVGDNAVVEL